jgi:HEAT repeat protein/ATP/ADP translocase
MHMSHSVKNQAIALLRVHPEELRMVALMAALFVCLQAGQGIGENAAFGLFLGRVNVDSLPYMYMGLGGFVSLASLVYATSLSRFRDASVVMNLLAASAVLFAVQWAAIAIFGLSFYSILWLTTYGMSVLSGTVLWTIAGEVCDARQAKRLFPLFTSMGILGSVFGNLLTGVFASVAGTDNLIALYAILLAIGFFLTRSITRLYFRAETVETKYSLINDMRAGFDFVRGSQLFRLVAVSAILYSLLFFTVDFPFSEITSIQFQGDEASLAGFKGVFTSITTAVTFLVSLFVANRFYARLGIISSILIMPITYAVGFIVFFASFSFGGAVFVRFAQLVFLGGIMGTAWNALFNVVPPERRGQVLAFNNGIPAQFGVFLSGLLIILSRQALETKHILLLGAFFAVVCIYLTMKMKPAYGDALLNALRAGRVEVFSDQDESFAGYQSDPVAMQVIRKALHDPKPYIRRLAVEMSAKTGNREILADLVDRLYDDDGSVRAAATRAVSEMGAGSALPDVVFGLDDPDSEVRAETLASLPRLELDPSPELTRTLERLLGDQDKTVQAHAALVLLHFGQSQLANQVLEKMLSHKDINQRRIFLRSLRHVATAVKDPIHIERRWIIALLQDKSVIVRRDAAHAARFVPDAAVIQSLGDLLADEDLAVRRNASESLRQLWPESRAVVLLTLEHARGDVVYAALDSIPAGDEDALLALGGYVQREVANLRFLRSLLAPLDRKAPAVSLLADTLRLRESKSEERLIKAVGLFGNPRALELIRKSLNAGDSSTRASALEALETLGDRTITQQILPILDRGGVFRKSADDSLDVQAAMAIFLQHEDHWIRALAARAVPELEMTDCANALRKLKKDRELLVRQAASTALALLDGEKMKTLKTLSTLERILLLREIPIFAGLGPEDLENIADIAHEELYSTSGIICREGDPGNTLFVIVSGDVQVVRSAGRQESILATRGAGEFVGEMAIIESSPRSATLRAMNDVRVLSIDGNAFKSILLDRPEVAVSVLRNMSSRIRALNAMVGPG